MISSHGLTQREYLIAVDFASWLIENTEPAKLSRMWMVSGNFFTTKQMFKMYLNTKK